MPLTLCQNQVTANIVADCDNLPKAGLDSVGILFNRSDIASYTRDALNPRKVTAITLVAGAVPIAVYNPTTNPFDGSGVELDTASAYPTFTKNVMVSVPNVGGDASKNIVEPLVKNRDGYVLILARKNQVADGGFIIIGSETGAVASADTQSFTDPALNGMSTVTLTETGAQYQEVCLTGATYAAAKATFDALLALVS